MEVVEARVTLEGIEGFLGELERIGDEHGVAVQALDARYVVGRDHLRRAVELAGRAFDRGENIARERSVEILLYAAATRQIDRALALGLAAGEQPAVIVIADEDGAGGTATADETAAADAVRALAGVAPASTLETYDESAVREWFDVGAAELEATDAGIPALVGERIALLTVEK